MAEQLLVVVERFDLTLYETIREKYAGVDSLTVIRDRRRGRRRRRPQMRYMDRRQSDRRTQPELDAQLRATGSFTTPAREATPPPAPIGVA